MSGLSLRARLLAIALLLVTVALLGSNALLVTLLQQDLVKQVDDRLQAAATVIARLGDLSGAVPDQNPVTGPETDFYIAYLDAGGEVEHVLRSTGPGAPVLPEPGARELGRPFGAGTTQGDQRWRVIVAPLTSPGGQIEQVAAVVIAGSLDEVDATIRQLGARTLLIDALVLLVLGVAGWFAVGRGLWPLRRIEATAAAIAEGDRSGRVPQLAGPGTELARLAASLNGMLERIEAGDAARAATAASMRRFVADASHELRTPLFGIKGFTELYRMGGLPERADVDTAMSRIEREAGRLTALVEDLLLLARLDEDATAAGLALHRTPMDLRTLAVDALHDLRALAPGRPVTLTGPGGAGPATGAPVLGDEARLRQVTSNLVGNVVAHTPPGTAVRIGVGTRGGSSGLSAVLEVQDEGPGMTPEQAARVFDRFYRADAARGRSEIGGSGLGLAIVQSLVAAHGGRVEVESAPGVGTTFRLCLEAETDPGADQGA